MVNVADVVVNNPASNVVGAGNNVDASNGNVEDARNDDGGVVSFK